MNARPSKYGFDPIDTPEEHGEFDGPCADGRVRVELTEGGYWLQSKDPDDEGYWYNGDDDAE